MHASSAWSEDGDAVQLFKCWNADLDFRALSITSPPTGRSKAGAPRRSGQSRPAKRPTPSTQLDAVSRTCTSDLPPPSDFATARVVARSSLVTVASRTRLPFCRCLEYRIRTIHHGAPRFMPAVRPRVGVDLQHDTSHRGTSRTHSPPFARACASPFLANVGCFIALLISQNNLLSCSSSETATWNSQEYMLCKQNSIRHPRHSLVF